MKDIFQIAVSNATSNDQESKDLIKKILLLDWVVWDSRIHKGVNVLANTFINNFASITMPDNDSLFAFDPTLDNTVYCPIPISVIRTKDVLPFQMIEGIVYSNGSVFLVYLDDEIITDLRIKKITKNTFDIPDPVLRE